MHQQLLDILHTAPAIQPSTDSSPDDSYRGEVFSFLFYSYRGVLFLFLAVLAPLYSYRGEKLAHIVSILFKRAYIALYHYILGIWAYCNKVIKKSFNEHLKAEIIVICCNSL